MEVKTLVTKVRQSVKSHAPGIALGTLSLVGLTGGASASGIDTANITAIIDSMGTIFPSLGNMVVVLVPTLIILGVVGFIMGFFDKILGMLDRLVK